MRNPAVATCLAVAFAVAIALAALLPGSRPRDVHAGDAPILTPRVVVPGLARSDGRVPIVVNTRPIEGYTDRVSVAPGGRLAFRVSTPAERFHIDILRLGEHERLVHSVRNLPGGPQHYPLDAFRRGAGWRTRYVLGIPKDWQSGLYAARLADDAGGEFYVTFVVTPGDGPRARIAVLANTNTWQAYNYWGGASFYVPFPDEQLPADPLLREGFGESIISTQRPNIVADPRGDEGHLANAELHVLRWLERNGYAYDLFSDRDLHDDPALLGSYDVFVISTHPEYWTERMYDGLEAFLTGGGNLLYLAGNGVYWKTVIEGDQLEVRYDGGEHELGGGRGGRWRSLGRPEDAHLGVAFTSAGYYTFAPFAVLEPGHWVFEGVDVAAGDLIGDVGLNKGHASGWETDKRGPATPANAVLLARGTNPDGGGAEMVYYDHPAGGGVFAAGSITFGGSLAVDERLSRIVRNVLDRFLADAAPGP
jgi:hypothetical protein